jgi:hypothetical protein
MAVIAYGQWKSHYTDKSEVPSGIQDFNSKEARFEELENKIFRQVTRVHRVTPGSAITFQTQVFFLLVDTMPIYFIILLKYTCFNLQLGAISFEGVIFC